jgi:hypothetical protein
VQVLLQHGQYLLSRLAELGQRLAHKHRQLETLPLIRRDEQFLTSVHLFLLVVTKHVPAIVGPVPRAAACLLAELSFVMHSYEIGPESQGPDVLLVQLLAAAQFQCALAAVAASEGCHLPVLLLAHNVDAFL